jgi:hypothetical protein
LKASSSEKSIRKKDNDGQAAKLCLGWFFKNLQPRSVIRALKPEIHVRIYKNVRLPYRTGLFEPFIATRFVEK